MLTSCTEAPCDPDGYDLPHNATAPPLDDEHPDDNYSPFNSHAEFEFSEFIYAEEGMSAGKIDKLPNILAALYPNDNPSVADHEELYSIIDAVKEGDIAWNSFLVQYNGEIPNNQSTVPLWIKQTYEVWFQNPLHVIENQVGNSNFKDEINYAPKKIFKLGKHQWTDLMSGNWS